MPLEPARKPSTPKLRVRFYRTATGKQIVKEELLALGVAPRAAVLAAISRRSHLSHFSREDELVKGPIRSIRTTLDGNEYRVLYALVGKHDHVILGLHALNKKSKKLPPQALKTAETRLKDWEARG